MLNVVIKRNVWAQWQQQSVWYLRGRIPKSTSWFADRRTISFTLRAVNRNKQKQILIFVMIDLYLSWWHWFCNWSVASSTGNMNVRWRCRLSVFIQWFTWFTEDNSTKLIYDLSAFFADWLACLSSHNSTATIVMAFGICGLQIHFFSWSHFFFFYISIYLYFSLTIPSRTLFYFQVFLRQPPPCVFPALT